MAMRSRPQQQKQVEKNGKEEESEEEEESQAPTQTQSSQKKSAPKQTNEERKQIRRGYRTLLNQTMDLRPELIQPESNGLDVALDESKGLFRKVKYTREAALDSEVLVSISRLGTERTMRLQTGLSKRDVSGFIGHVRKLLLSKEGDESQEITKSGWDSLAKLTSKYVSRTPTIDNMVGPLGIVPPERKERKKIEKDKLSERVAPENIAANRELTQEELNQDARKRVAVIREKLEETKKMNFFNFILDPHSFTQSIENIFHYSFLVKDGQAALMVQNDVPYAAPTQPPTEDDAASGRADRKQCVVKFDYKTYQDLLKAYHIKEATLPRHKNSDDTEDASQMEPSTQGIEVTDYEDSQSTPSQAKGKRKGASTSSQSKRGRK
eukprot:TRINITY_DN1660_c0_g1_i1.p1 TRINITY_DN1660_c0_g1~~TRINITY_DN1660_c0_g1_i1.p1  ORF type:complete len:381 (-),score=129.78 TRINITY_DN1660_c0_g1_i1:18-1160(-)